MSKKSRLRRFLSVMLKIFIVLFALIMAYRITDAVIRRQYPQAKMVDGGFIYNGTRYVYYDDRFSKYSIVFNSTDKSIKLNVSEGDNLFEEIFSSHYYVHGVENDINKYVFKEGDAGPFRKLPYYSEKCPLPEECMTDKIIIQYKTSEDEDKEFIITDKKDNSYVNEILRSRWRADNNLTVDYNLDCQWITGLYFYYEGLPFYVYYR